MRLCENWLRSYAEYTANSEAPLQMHFWTGVSVLAGALRRHVWIDQRFFQWTPNFYIILVGPPGIVAKSTTMNLGYNLLTDISGIHFGPNSMTWQGLTKALAEARELVPYGEDYLPMSCITCGVSELGTFLQPKEPKLVDVLTDLWDGQKRTWRHKIRTADEITIENPWINVIACTTPSWIRDNLNIAMIEGGLLRRVLFVFGNKKRQLVPYPAKAIPKGSFDTLSEALKNDLEHIGSLTGEYYLSDEAELWGSQWYEQLWNNRPEHLTDERLGGYVATKQTHIHKVAMVLAASQRDELVIEKEDLELADTFVTGLEHDMQIVLQTISATPEGRNVTMIMSIVDSQKSVSQRTVWRACMHDMTLKDFAEATDAAMKAGYLKLLQDGTEILYISLRDKD